MDCNPDKTKTSLIDEMFLAYPNLIEIAYSYSMHREATSAGETVAMTDGVNNVFEKRVAKEVFAINLEHIFKPTTALNRLIFLICQAKPVTRLI